MVGRHWFSVRGHGRRWARRLGVALALALVGFPATQTVLEQPSAALAQAVPIGTLTTTGSLAAAGDWPFVTPVSPADTAKATYKETGSLNAQWQTTGAPTFAQPITLAAGSEAFVQQAYGASVTCPCTQITATYPAVLTVSYHATNTIIESHNDPHGMCGTTTRVDDVTVSVVNQSVPLVVHWVVGRPTSSPPVVAYGVNGGARSQATNARGTQTETETVTMVPCTGTGFSATYPGGNQLVGDAVVPLVCASSSGLVFGCTGRAQLLSPTQGSATTAPGCVIGYGFPAINSSGSACGGKPGGNWSLDTRWTLPGAYKIGFYSSDLHATARFIRPDGTSETIGKAPRTNNLLATIAGQSQTGQSIDDSGISWDWAIIYPVTQSQFQSGLDVAHNAASVSIYNITQANCTQFLQDIARAAGVTLPDLNDYFAPLVGTLSRAGANGLLSQFKPSGVVAPTPDGWGMSQALNQLYLTSNGVYAGGYVQSTDGSTIGHAPDPPGPIDPGSIGKLAQAALSNPAGTATKYGLSYSTRPLPKGVATTGATFTLDQVLSGDTTSMVLLAIDWGDGSQPGYYLLSDPTPTGDALIPHTYTTPGTYTDTVVVVENGVLAKFSGSVDVGADPLVPQTLIAPLPGLAVSYVGPGDGPASSGTPELDSLLLLGAGLSGLGLLGYGRAWRHRRSSRG